MVKTTWVLESDVFSETCFDEMISHFKTCGISHHVVKIIPFIHEIQGTVPEISGPVMVYGSIGIQKMAHKHGWKPGVFPVPTEAETQKALGDLYLNADAVRMNISEVSDYLTEGHTFIKPDTDTKEFAGQIIDAGEFITWYQGMVKSGYLDNNDFPVVLSKPKKLGCEWRVAVVDGKIVTSSIYRQYGIVKPQRHIIPEVQEAVELAISRFKPTDAYVIDIAQVGDEYKVIEYNSINSAGFYACDVGAIIDAINDLTLPK